MDTQYIEELRALEDKKEAKAKLIEYGEQFGLKLKKTRSFDNLIIDISEGLKALADEPLPETEGLSISDLIDAADEASKLGLSKTFNMIVLGGYLKIKPIVELENVIKGLKQSLPERHHHLIPENEKAINRGMKIITQTHSA